jgi:hypothetical protein
MGKLLHLRPQRPPAPNADVEYFPQHLLADPPLPQAPQGAFWTPARDGDVCRSCRFPFVGPVDGRVLWSVATAHVFCGVGCWRDHHGWPQ